MPKKTKTILLLFYSLQPIKTKSIKTTTKDILIFRKICLLQKPLDLRTFEINLPSALVLDDVVFRVVIYFVP